MKKSLMKVGTIALSVALFGAMVPSMAFADEAQPAKTVTAEDESKELKDYNEAVDAYKEAVKAAEAKIAALNDANKLAQANKNLTTEQKTNINTQVETTVKQIRDAITANSSTLDADKLNTAVNGAKVEAIADTVGKIEATNSLKEAYGKLDKDDVDKTFAEAENRQEIKDLADSRAKAKAILDDLKDGYVRNAEEANDVVQELDAHIKKYEAAIEQKKVNSIRQEQRDKAQKLIDNGNAYLDNLAPREDRTADENANFTTVVGAVNALKKVIDNKDASATDIAKGIAAFNATVGDILKDAPVVDNKDEGKKDEVNNDEGKNPGTDAPVVDDHKTPAKDDKVAADKKAAAQKAAKGVATGDATNVFAFAVAGIAAALAAVVAFLRKRFN